MRSLLAASVSVLLLAATGCHSMMVSRPASKSVDAAYTRAWVAQLQREGQSGDIILARGYALVSDLIDAGTDGEDISHAVVYDAKRGTIIEAVAEGVHEVPLTQFVDRVHQVILVRPAGLTRLERSAALDRARAMIGREYDYAGLLGFDDPDTFYCSELITYAIRAAERGLEVETVVIPSHLVRYGEVIFDSGPRDEAAMVASSD